MPKPISKKQEMLDTIAHLKLKTAVEEKLLESIPYAEAVIFVSLRDWLWLHPRYVYNGAYVGLHDEPHYIFKHVVKTPIIDALGVTRSYACLANCVDISFIVLEREPGVGTVSEISKKKLVKTFTESWEETPDGKRR
jgi:hypothetical protein